MTSMDQHKPGAKSGKRKQKKARKAEQRKVQAASEPIETAIAPEAVVARAAAVEAPAAPVQAEPMQRVASLRERIASVAPPPNAADKPAAPADAMPSPGAAPVTGLQAIANAWRDYTRKSLQDAQSFAEKLTAARSLDKAVEAQTEFARQACETFADNSRKIRELHRELFWQAFRMPNWPVGRSSR